MLKPVKDKLGLKVAGIYRVTCECSKIYIRQMGRTIETRCKVLMRHICLGQPEKSKVAEHRFNTGHSINFGSTFVLDKATGYVDNMIKGLLRSIFIPGTLTGKEASCLLVPGIQ